jgi:methylmalonyl-CoA/ethylmalonyl-CoA epimerase
MSDTLLRVSHFASGWSASLVDKFNLHHVGIAVQGLSTAIPIFQSLFGYELNSGPYDDPLQRVSVCFISRGPGDPTLELVAPLGPGSPIDRVLRQGGGTYHICYEVPDINAAISSLTEQGSFLISGPVPAVAFEMRDIAWLMTEVGLLVELVQAQSRRISELPKVPHDPPRP